MIQYTCCWFVRSFVRSCNCLHFAHWCGVSLFFSCLMCTMCTIYNIHVLYILKRSVHEMKKRKEQLTISGWKRQKKQKMQRVSERHYNFHTKTQFVMSSIFSHCTVVHLFSALHLISFFTSPARAHFFSLLVWGICVHASIRTCFTQKRTIRQCRRYIIGWRGWGERVVGKAKCENTQKATKSKNECTRMGEIKTQQRC